MNTNLEQLFQNIEDGDISSAEHEKLMGLLREDASVREAYLDHMEFVGLLHSKAEALAELESPPPVKEAPRKPRRLLRPLLAAAAVITVSAYFASQFLVSTPPTARVTPSLNAMWSYIQGGIDQTQSFTPGTTIILESGTLELGFKNSTELVLEGPAKLSILNPEEVKMPYGRLWARASGDHFVVHTKRLKIVDLGTEFGVTASESLDEEVHVAKGRAHVIPINDSLSSSELTTGQAVRANAIGKLRSTLFDSSSYQTSLTSIAPYIHWSFDEIKDGSFPSQGRGLPEAPLSVYSLDDRHTPITSPPTPGRFGNCLRLDSIDHFAQANFLGIESNLPRTVALWVKAPASTDAKMFPLVSWGLPSDLGEKWVLTVDGDGQKMGTVWGGAWVQSDTTPLFDDNWHHLVFVFTGQIDHEGRPEILHYQNGEVKELRGPAPSHPLLTDCSAQNSWLMTIGTQLFTAPQRPTFQGAIDELYVFRRALTHREIRTLHEKNILEKNLSQQPQLSENAK